MSALPDSNKLSIRPKGGRFDERIRSIPLLSRLVQRPELGAAAGTFLVLVFFMVTAGKSGMFGSQGILNFLEISAQLGILAVAVSILMIGGEFDLSVGSMIAFAGIVIGLSVTVFHLPLWLAILVTFAAAAAVGWLNGYLIIRTGLPSFIVTLASMYLLRGASLVLSRSFTGRTQISNITEGAQDSFTVQLFAGRIGRDLFIWLAHNGLIEADGNGLPMAEGIPMSFIWWLVLGSFGTWLLLRSTFGNWIFAVGGSESAARNSGVPVNRVKIILFIISAMTATHLATIQVLEAGSADTLRGLQKEFEAIIASVIGGNLLTGGYGSVIGGMFGSLIFGTVSTGIFYTGVDTDWFRIFLGAMIVIAVLFNDFIRRRVIRNR
ncbi:MAG: ABC transporter permease [Parvibaculaceae bacterium]